MVRYKIWVDDIAEEDRVRLRRAEEHAPVVYLRDTFTLFLFHETSNFWISLTLFCVFARLRLDLKLSRDRFGWRLFQLGIWDTREAVWLLLLLASYLLICVNYCIHLGQMLNTPLTTPTAGEINKARKNNLFCISVLGSNSSPVAHVNGDRLNIWSRFGWFCSARRFHICSAFCTTVCIVNQWRWRSKSDSPPAYFCFYFRVSLLGSDEWKSKNKISSFYPKTTEIIEL